MAAEGHTWRAQLSAIARMGAFATEQRRYPIRNRRLLAFIVVFLAPVVVSQAANAAPPYPNPAPSFARAAPANRPLYGFFGGSQARPVLVIYAQYSDIPAPAAQDEAFLAGRYFGTSFPNAVDYFKRNSFGKLNLTAAVESYGTPNNGVVIVNVGNAAAFRALSPGDQDKKQLMLADPFVNFASFDRNGDGKVTDDELGVASYVTARPPLETGCGQTNGTSALTLDGKDVAPLQLAGTVTDTNLLTQFHELGHAMFNAPDLYGFGIGSLDLYGPTCGYADSTFFDLNAWQKMNLGWITPTVVVKDGFYDVPRADTSGAAFILYDPSKGTNDYFIVENREPTAGTYDQSASDSGLVVWRADNAVAVDQPGTVPRPIELITPDGSTKGNLYGGSSTDAWDPSDPSTPQRTMTNTWRDGTAANVALRAIGNRGDPIRAYFDVRGPGVLVDTYTLNASSPPNVTPDEANSISFPVMNTGEATDTFNFTITGLPAGWSATTNTQTLGAGVGSTASVQLTPAPNAATGFYALNATGTSTTDGSVTSSCSFTVNVVLDRTLITYTGATSKPTGEPAGLAALVTDPDDAGSPPVPSAPVTFDLGGGTLSAVAATNLSGIAAASPTLTLLPGTYTLVVSTPRVGKHAPASISLLYTVERRPTALVYSGVTTAEYSDPATVSAVLTDTLSGTLLIGKPIDFTLGSQSASGTTGVSGAASATIVITQAAGTVSVGAAFAGDTIYLPSSDSKPFVIDKEDLTFAYIGDALVLAPATPILRSAATQEPDGFPGDLTLAEASFHLAPTLTPTSFDYTTSVDAAGLSSIAATGLPADVWTATISVPATNPYWEGSSTSAAELIVVNPFGQVSGGGSGLDSAANRATVELTGRYHGTTPKGVIQLRSSAGRFLGKDLAWIVVSGDQAILQVDGTLTGAPATLRLRIRDAGEPGLGRDTFSSMLGGYSSGFVVLDRGNLQVH
jgi:M6 family metalloprotease-like protein